MWKHGLAPKERRILARVVRFHSAWTACRRLGAARTRAESARAGPRPQRESERKDAQARYTRKPPREVRGRTGTWEHGLAPKERRLLARAVPFHEAWRKYRQRGAARTRAGSACAGPRPQRERAQRRASALHAQATSRSEGQGWHVGARAGVEGTAASRSCSALPQCVEQVSPARRGARASEAHTLGLVPKRPSAVARKRAKRASHLAL